MDNSDIIRLCAAGDREAMALLYRRYSHKMLSLIRRYISDTAAAEDILHDGFIIIFTRIKDVRSEDKLEYWMGKIMKNLSLNYLGGLDIMQILDEEHDIPETPDLEEILSYKELAELIEHLPEGYRNIFKLAILENKTHNEIGKILGIAPHSSSSQLYHARVMLKKMIQERRVKLGLIMLALLSGVSWLLLRDRKGDTPVIASHDKEQEPSVSRPSSAEGVGEQAVIDIIEECLPSKAYSSPVADTVHKEITIQIVNTKPDTIPSEDTDSMVPPAPVIAPPKESISTYKPLLASTTKAKGFSVGVQYSMTGSMLDLSVFKGSSLDAEPPIWSDPMPPVTDPDHPDFNEIMEEVDNELPLTLGININKTLNPRLSIETGISYTLMSTNIRYIGKAIDAHRKVKTSYIGIPLKLNYNFYRKSAFTLYGTFGASFEIPVGSTTSVRWVTSPAAPDKLPELSSKPYVSLFGGLGAQYSITPDFSLYIEPSVRYWFDNHSILPSYWQQHEFMISVPIGLRLTW